MSTITSLKLGSVPITEEGVERYRFSDNIENHFTQIYERIEDLNCSVGRVFSKMKVTVSWFEIMNANYLIADMEINNPSGSVLHIKGWIDSIDMVSDSEDYPQVEIRWHFDYYEMYKSMITFGYGHVKRRPFRDLDTTPVQDYQYRYLRLPDNFKSTAVDLCPRYGSWYDSGHTIPTEIWWIIVCYSHIENGHTYIKYGICPTGIYVAADGKVWGYQVEIKMGSDPSKVSPSLQAVLNGNLDEEMGISPSSISGVWLSPYFLPLTSYSGTGRSGDPIVVSYSSVSVKAGVGQYGFFTISDSNILSQEWSVSLTDVVSSEDKRYIVTDLDGAKALELPYDYAASSAKMTLNVEPTQAYITASFDDDTYGRTEGMVATIVLPSLPVNENAWSDYVYSGQRDFDREARTIQSNANAWKSSAAGGGQGAMMGAFGAPGLALGVAGGVSGGLINYGVEMLYQNDEEQRILDRLKANQIPGIIMGGGCWSIARYCGGILLTWLEMDAYSDSQMINTRNNFGVSVDEILGLCDNLVRNELPDGYYSIKNLIISGAAPKEAKDYIKNKFDAGVKLL